MCGTEESVFHLFFECPFFAGIWYHISSWMGISTALHKDGMDHLEQFEGLIGSGRAFTERVKVIWFACIWCIWRSRNEKLFKNKEINMLNMVEHVKRWSWNWLKIKSSSIDYIWLHCIYFQSSGCSLVTWSEIPRDPIFLDPISDISVVSNASAVLVP